MFIRSRYFTYHGRYIVSGGNSSTRFNVDKISGLKQASVILGSTLVNTPKTRGAEHGFINLVHTLI